MMHAMQSTRFLADRPLSVTWELTRGAAAGRSLSRSSAELTARQSSSVLSQIAEMSPKILLLCGDPVLRPDLLELAARADALGLWVAFRPALHARSFALDYNAYRRAGVRGLSICLGDARVDGTDRRIAWGCAALTAAHRSRIPVQLKTTASGLSNLSELFRLVRIVQPTEWRVSVPVHPRPPGSLDARTVESLLQALGSVPSAMGIPFTTSDAPHFRRISIQSHARPHPKHRRILPLNDGRGRLFISHRGEIQPGATLPITCGNVKRHHPLDVYRDATVFRQLRDPDLLKGKCGRCGFRLVCGGSRARAYATTKDYLSADPLCAFEPSPPLSLLGETPRRAS